MAGSSGDTDLTGSDQGIPGTIAAAWGVRERPHKGPKPALSLPRIVAAAVQVADTEGLDAVSMGRVAAELAPLAGLQAGTGRTYIAEELRKLTDLAARPGAGEGE